MNNSQDAWTIEEVYAFIKEHFSDETADKFKGRCCQTLCNRIME